MFSNGLSLEQSPPLKASMPFFLTAPIFLLIASILYLFNDLDLLDRWLPSTVGIVHFFNLGFLTMVIMGALTQMLPVLAGVTIPNVLGVSRLVYFLITLGSLLFPLGMIYMNLTMIQIGALSAWSAIFIFFSVALYALQKGIPSFTLTIFKLSSLSALITLIWAGRLAWAWAGVGEFSVYRIPMIELHIAWAVFGMVFILVMGVSYKVVPMFYVTPDHPRWLTHYAAKTIFSLLLLWTLIFQTYLFEKFVWLQSLIPILKIGISIVVITFSIETIRRLNNRKRPIVDTSIIYWKLSMTLFALGALLYALSQFITESDKISIFASASFGIALLSLISGMLYKIIPFLVWFHLNAQGKNPPVMRELLPDRLTRKQLYLHFGVVLFLGISILFPGLKFIFILFITCSLVSNLYLLSIPLRIYRRTIMA